MTEVNMAGLDIVSEKRILAVDDEKDVLEVIQEQLETARLTTAADFSTAKAYLEKESFDLVILDIMGVNGFELLDLATAKKTPAVMLTAHALTPDSFQKSIDKGAVSFLPKDELARLNELVAEILGEVAEQRTHWPKLQERLGPKFTELWGELWHEIKFPPETKIPW
jgi:DNA-binding NtrC family response regulator